MPPEPHSEAPANPLQRKGGRDPGTFPVRELREAPPREEPFPRFTPHEHRLADTLQPHPVPSPAQLAQAADVLKDEANRLAQVLGSNALDHLPPRVPIAVRREMERLRALDLAIRPVDFEFPEP